MTPDAEAHDQTNQRLEQNHTTENSQQVSRDIEVFLGLVQLIFDHVSRYVRDVVHATVNGVIQVFQRLVSLPKVTDGH